MTAKNSKNLFLESDLEILPIEKAKTIPSQWYYEEEYFDFERTHLFNNHWNYLCHENQVQNPGQAYTTQVAGNPVIVFRTSSNEIKAFYNVCKHRGGPLAIKKGTKTVLQCQYHGWTYLDDGSLRGIPDWNLVELFDKKDFGLEPIEIETWQGLIFSRVKKSTPKIESILTGIGDRIAPIKLEDLEFHSEQTYDIKCNWKVYVDNYLEGYHIPIVHPELADLLDYRAYVTETEIWHSLQHSPFKAQENLYSKNGGEAFYYFVFPNMMLNILPGRLQVNQVIPVSAKECKVIFSYFYSDIKAKTKSELIRNDLAYSHDIQMEDVEICEAVQLGLQSSVYDQGRFSVKREQGVYHFQSLIKSEFKKGMESV